MVVVQNESGNPRLNPYRNSNLFSGYYLKDRIDDLEGWDCDEEADGFAGFRETATKTNSPVDRLRKLTLPAVGDVREGLESYLQTKSRGEELEGKIERTDALIDEIVYELYGLTDEEIEVVEETIE